MNKVSIFHNPQCSKSRKALELLREAGIEPEIIEYLKTAPDAAEIEKLIAGLGGDPMLLVRAGDPLYSDSGIAGHEEDASLVAAILSSHPALIQRPVIVCQDHVVIGRPPERALEVIS